MTNEEMIQALVNFLGTNVSVAYDRETRTMVGVALTLAQVERVMIGFALAEQMLRAAVMVEMPKDKPS